MLSHFTKHFKYVALAVFAFLYRPAIAQNNYHAMVLQVDSLVKAGLPKSAMIINGQLDSVARKNNNIAAQLQAIIFHVNIQPGLDDDGQAGSITWLEKRTAQASYPLKAILQSLLGQLFWQYYQQNRYSISQRSHLQHAGADFTNWDMQAIIDHAAQLYDLSLHDAAKEQNTPVGIIGDALQGDSSTRHLRPALYDLLLHRALYFLMANEVNITKPRLPFELNDPRYFSNASAFAGLQITTTDTASAYYKGIRYLQQGTVFHLKDGNKAALADLDIQRLDFLYENSGLANKDTLYIAALKQLAADFSSIPLAAQALTQLGTYYMNAGDNGTALAWFKKAADAYPKSLAGLNAANYTRAIMQTRLQAVVEEVNSRGQPVLASLDYRNLKTVKVILYKVWATQYNQLAAMRSENYSYGYNSQVEPIKQVFDYLQALKPLRTETLQLPAADDYNLHTTEFKIDALPIGIYIMVLQDPKLDSVQYFQLASFKVTHLSSVSRHIPDGRSQITVMDRETGVPLAGVQVTADETNVQTSDANGASYFNLNGKVQYAVKLTTQTDTLYTPTMYRDLFVINAATDRKRLVFFTDREIYRPGQVIYFKGLYLSLHNGKNALLSKENISYAIDDDNGRELAKMNVTTNDFGSFSGSYVIPPNILNGYITISTPNGRKQVAVEEYKRPNFMVSFLPVSKSYKPGDSVTVKGTVTAYSGYGLSQARVAVHITTLKEIHGYLPYKYHVNNLSYRTEDFLADTINTDEHGGFTVKFRTTGDEGEGDMQYHYNINADVTYGSGETRSAHTNVDVAKKNIAVYAVVPQKLVNGDSIKIITAIHNLDGIAQPGNITLSVYALKSPGKLFKGRLWTIPDKYLLSRADYEKYFPGYAYASEDKPENWPVIKKINELSLATATARPAIFDQDILKDEPTGTYKIVINVKNSDGDTASNSYYINVFSKPWKPLGEKDWAVYTSTGKANGNLARFFVGTGKPGNVLLEKFNDNKLTFSKWLHIKGNNQQVVDVPVDNDGSRQDVQLLSVSQNPSTCKSR